MAKNDATPENTDWRRQAREIADSLAIAFILAMVIRHYVLEVFKIPTKSMQPTLLGDPWTGDKILVNKFAFDFADPERWDVVVFKYPDNVSKNYIKRLVGLPGETIQVRDGDVYIDNEIARKPWPVQEALWRLRPHSALAKNWRVDNPEAWSLKDGAFEADATGTDDAQYISYGREILGYEERDFQISHRPFVRMPTSDVMVEFRLEPQALQGDVLVDFDVETAVGMTQRVDLWRVRLPVGAGEQRPQIVRFTAPVTEGEAYTLAAGKPAVVQVCNVDRTLIVRMDGRELLRHEYEPASHLADWRGFERGTQVLIGCKQGHVVLRDLSLYVDVHYTRFPAKRAVHEPHTVGPDEFFVLGDNSCNSNDSRGWDTPTGGVPRRYLVGEAFLVLWPLGRMKIVR